jgi:hypothetical protein
MVLQVLLVRILFIYEAFINLRSIYSPNPATTPHRNLATTPRHNPAATPHHIPARTSRRNRNQGTTPHRNRNQVNTPRHQKRKKTTIPGKYDESCSTSTLRRHLANDHWDAWITSCMESSIEITSTSVEVRKAFDKFERKHGHRGDNTRAANGSFPIHRPYSPKTFLEAIIRWIVADDQVCLPYLL